VKREEFSARLSVGHVGHKVDIALFETVEPLTPCSVDEPELPPLFFGYVPDDVRKNACGKAGFRSENLRTVLVEAYADNFRCKEVCRKTGRTKDEKYKQKETVYAHPERRITLATAYAAHKTSLLFLLFPNIEYTTFTERQREEQRASNSFFFPVALTNRGDKKDRPGLRGGPIVVGRERVTACCTSS